MSGDSIMSIVMVVIACVVGLAFYLYLLKKGIIRSTKKIQKANLLYGGAILVCLAILFIVLTSASSALVKVVALILFLLVVLFFVIFYAVHQIRGTLGDKTGYDEREIKTMLISHSISLGTIIVTLMGLHFYSTYIDTALFYTKDTLSTVWQVIVLVAVVPILLSQYIFAKKR